MCWLIKGDLNCTKIFPIWLSGHTDFPSSATTLKFMNKCFMTIVCFQGLHLYVNYKTDECVKMWYKFGYKLIKIKFLVKKNFKKIKKLIENFSQH